MEVGGQIARTTIVVEQVWKGKFLQLTSMQDQQLFENIITFPDPESQRRYDELVGVEEIKNRLIKESAILLNPGLLADWSKAKHGSIIALTKVFQDRHSFFIFAGDVGTGKSTLAETFGDSLARKDNLSIDLYKLSLNTRGGGNVGEMTRLISKAFEEVRTYAAQFKPSGGKYSSACILLIDEADALAQSRELDQMNHEDRAGVNALIRGIDSLNKGHLPVITIMCTNRLTALDPAVVRRAAAVFEFVRPDEKQRVHILRTSLHGTGITDDQVNILAKATGDKEGKDYGYTYSDLIQKFLPALLLGSFPDNPVTFEKAQQIANQILPTPPFNENRKI